MTRIAQIFRRMMINDSGATAMEYGLLAAIISVAIITGATSAGTSLNTLFTNIGTKLGTEAALVK